MIKTGDAPACPICKVRPETDSYEVCRDKMMSCPQCSSDVLNKTGNYKILENKKK